MTGNAKTTKIEVVEKLHHGGANLGRILRVLLVNLQSAHLQSVRIAEVLRFRIALGPGGNRRLGASRRLSDQRGK
jgi:hypothetical protein